MKIINASDAPLTGAVVAQAQRLHAAAKLLVTRPLKKITALASDIGDVFIFVARLGATESSDQVLVLKSGYPFKIVSAGNDEVNGPWLTWEGGIAPFQVQLCYRDPEFGDYTYPMSDYVVNVEANLMDAAGNLELGQTYYMTKLVEEDPWWADDLEGEQPQDRIGLLITDDTGRQLFAPFTPADTDPLSAVYTQYGPPPTCTPIVQWADPADILGGAPLTELELNAAVKIPGTSTDLPGVFTYDPPLTTVLAAGPHTLSVTFQATDATHYLPAVATATLVVGKSAQTITVTEDHWIGVTGVPYTGETPDTPLVGNTSHGSHGDDLFVGGTGRIQAHCTSGQAVNYFSSNPEVATIDILSGDVTLISRGEADSGVSFHIVAPENDAFFEATYDGQTHNFALLQLDPSDITFTVDSPIEYGEPLAVTTSAPIAGAWDIDPVEGTILDVTTTIPHSITGIFTPEDIENYATNQEFDVDLDVTAATPVITWAPLDMVYGDLFGDTIMNAVATNPHTGLVVAGDYVYAIYARENVLAADGTTSADNTGADLIVDFTPTGLNAANHTTATATRSLVMGTRGVTVQAIATSKTYGELDPVFTYTATGFIDGEIAADNLTGYLARTSSTSEGVGTYQITIGTLAGNQNYHIATFVGADFNIVPGNRNPVLTSLVKTSGNYRGDSIVLTATASDPESDPITYTWSYSFGGSAYTGVNDGTNVGGFTPSLPGTYICTVSVSDGNSVYTHVKSLSVVVLNRTSAANFTSSHVGEWLVGDTTTLTNTTPADPDGDSQTFAFTVESCPPEGDPYGTIVEVSAGVATFSPDAAGEWIIKLTVTDAVGGVSSATTTVTAAVGAASLTWATIGGMTYGDRLDASRLTATTGVAGTFVYKVGGVTVASGAAGALTFYPSGGFLPSVGSVTVDVEFTPTNPWESDYASDSQTVTVSKKALTVTATGTSRYYTGTVFSGGFGVSYSGLIAGEQFYSLSGSLVYGGTSQGASDPGTYTIVPSGLTSVNYQITFVAGALTILRGTASAGAAFSLPPFVVAGVALGSVLADASSASVAGSWAYMGETGALTSASVLAKDTGYAVDATFTPTSNLYAVVTLTSGFVVKGVPVITWATPEPITYGTRLSAVQLNASCNAAGTFTYDPPTDTMLGAGEHALAAYFTPSDPTNWTDATDGVWLTVGKAVPAFTFTITVPSILVGASLVWKYALDNPMGGPVTYRLDSEVGEVISIDDYIFTVPDSGRWVFALRAETNDFLAATSSDGVEILAPAELSWATPAPITYGTALSATQLNATANVPGVFTYDPPDGTILDAGEHALAVTFTPSNPVQPAIFGGVWLTVDKAVALGFIIDVDSIPLNSTLAGKYTLVNLSGATPLAYYQKSNGTWVLFDLDTFVFTESRASMTVTVAVSAGPNYTDTVKSDTVRVGGLPQTISAITITGDIVDRKGGGVGVVSATASSGLAVTFSSNSTNVYFGNFTGGNILCVAPGTYTVYADQPGNSTYAAAARVSILLTVKKAAQPLDFSLSPSTVSIGGTSQITVIEDGYGTGALSFYSNGSQIATVSGMRATGQSAGSVWITMLKQADVTYEAVAMAHLLTVTSAADPTGGGGWTRVWTSANQDYSNDYFYSIDPVTAAPLADGAPPIAIVSPDGLWRVGMLGIQGGTEWYSANCGSTFAQMNAAVGMNFSSASFPNILGGDYAPPNTPKLYWLDHKE